jgi:YYY domain-containing protein
VIDALQFWLVVEGLGLLALPLCAFLFARLPGGGLAFARPLGLLLASYPAWLLSSVGLLRYQGISILLAVAILTAAAALLWRLSPRARVARGTPLVLWATAGAVFAAAFFGWTLLRSFSPEIWQTEKPMDMAFVNSIQRSGSFPPPDPWLAGHTINYYYYGHYTVAFVSRAAHVGPEEAFNLGVALFYALTAVSVFALASALVLAARGAAAGHRSALLGGLAAVAFAVVAGNIAGGVEYLRDPGALRTYDWWGPSRVIADTATEFPFFSFLLADLHAHVMAAPFALLVLAYSLQLCLAGPPPFRPAPAAVVELLLAGVALGSLYAINTFDYPTAVVLGVFAVAIRASTTASRRERALAAAWIAAWAAVSVLAFLPFFLRFSPTTKGIGLVHTHSTFTRFVADQFLIYGLALWAVVTLFVARRRLSFRYLAWGTTAAVFVLTLLAAHRLAGLALVLGLAAFALHVALGPRFPSPERFLWLLIAGGVGLIALAEFVYVRDVFDGTPTYRFNTVFKTGYQAWFLFAVAAGCIVILNRAWLGRRVRAVWLAGFLPLGLLAAAYPIAGSYSRSRGFTSSPTLDGLQWLERQSPDDVRAIKWLRRNVTGSPTVLEAVGDDFDAEGHARISTFTGLPTVLGWDGHEIQWGHDPGMRREDVARLYATTNLLEARRLLSRYRVRYIVVGSLERAAHPPAALAKFHRLADPAFRAPGTVVYRVRRMPSNRAS